MRTYPTAGMLLLGLVGALTGCPRGSGETGRAPQPVTATRPSTATLLFVGDVSLARGIESEMRKRSITVVEMLEGVAPQFHEADLVAANLECVVAAPEGLVPAQKRWRLRCDPTHVRRLPDAGIDLVTISNNHALDYGEEGFARTISNVRAAGLRITPWSEGREAQEPLLVDVNGLRFAFLAYNKVSYETDTKKLRRKPYWLRRKQALRDIRAAKEKGIVVVEVHWGREYVMRVPKWKRSLAHAMIDAGATLVIGHHPHVPQSVERYHGGLIAYSLGNFLFDMLARFKHLRTRRGFMLEVVMNGKKIESFELIPIDSGDDFRPFVDANVDTKSWIFEKISTPYRFSDHLRDATVRRVRGKEVVDCSRFEKRGPKMRWQYLTWLRPRWVCKGEPGYMSVGLAGERSGSVYREGIWAHPNGHGWLEARFPGVPLGTRLVGHAGIPDFPLRLAKGKGYPPVRLAVEIHGKAIATIEVPYRPGWVDLDIDTSAWKGSDAEVVVKVSGGSGDAQTGFSWDLWVQR